MDITPNIPKDSKIINAYGNGSFTVNTEVIESSIIIAPQKVIAWDKDTFTDVTAQDIEWVYEHKPDILLFGTGEIFHHLPLELKNLVYSQKIPFETMTTAAAVRTYNILLHEERKIVAFLIKI